MSDHEEQEQEEVDPVRRTLDLFVFAPVGVALTVAEDLPGLIAKGRERVENHIRNARVIGEFVVTQGQKEVGNQVGKLLHRDGGADGSAATAAPAAERHDTPDSAPTHPQAQTAPAPAPPAPTPKPAADPADAVIVEGALAGYDTLSASQVVRRLESLGPDELRAVHRHEASHRNRRTILNRATQLLDGTGSPAATASSEPDASPR